MRCTYCGHEITLPTWLVSLLFLVLIVAIVYGVPGTWAIRDVKRERADWRALNDTVRARLAAHWVLVPPDGVVTITPKPKAAH